MTHHDAGHYAAKHSKEVPLDPKVAEAISRESSNGKISCAAAHRISEETKISPDQVGASIDLMELKIYRCQLGLFGYSPEKRIVKPLRTVSPEIEAAIMGALTNDCIPCVAVWNIAKGFGLPTMDIAAACEALEIKILPCQLGAFK